MSAALPKHTLEVMREMAPPPVVERLVDATLKDNAVDCGVESVFEMQSSMVDVCPACQKDADGTALLRIQAALQFGQAKPGWEEA
jgi:hypothetical protein